MINKEKGMWPFVIVAGLATLLFSTKNDKKKKPVFISFAIEDAEYRDNLVKQANKERSPFDFVDMSVREEWNQDVWKDKCRAKIKECAGVIAMLSKHTHNAGGARWEMKCAQEEGIKIIGMHIFKNNKGAIPPELKNVHVIEWTWENLEQFINKL